jgi:UDP-N-acetylmuramyl pentapeptide phosphotransferase/UDP-N-acetylglucosamine-1-phosphate transferase
VRLITQLICALLIVAGGGVIESPVIEVHSESVQFFLKVLTIFTFLSLINAANFIDGLNGLLSLSIIITLIFAGIWIDFYPPLAILHYTLIAALLGFFFFNFPEGRIFMGDTGSTFLGLTLGFFALMAQQHYSVFTHPETAIFNKGFVFTLLPMAFLWFDVIATLCKRAVAGKRLTEAHREHMIHILFDKGYGHTFVTLLYASCTIFMGYLTYQCYKEHISFLMLLSIYGITQILFILFVLKVPACNKQRTS